MYICNVQCPELDLAGLKHCVVGDPYEMYERYADGCPCGNNPNWVKNTSVFDEEIQSSEGKLK